MATTSSGLLPRRSLRRTKLRSRRAPPRPRHIPARAARLRFHAAQFRAVPPATTCTLFCTRLPTNIDTAAVQWMTWASGCCCYATRSTRTRICRSRPPPPPRLRVSHTRRLFLQYSTPALAQCDDNQKRGKLPRREGLRDDIPTTEHRANEGFLLFPLRESCVDATGGGG